MSARAPVAQPSHPVEAAPPPTAVVWVSVLVCVAGALMVLLGGWRVGIWTDEQAHVIRYANLQEHGSYLLDDDLDRGEPGAWVTDQYVYAPVTTQVMHGVNRMVGLDPADRLGTSLRAYSARHLVVGVLGLLGVMAVAGIGRRLLGSWRWGAVAAATLVAIPMWPGLSMFDIKDIPAATGYTWVTWGLVELLRGGRRVRVGPAALLAAGLVLAVGTRPGLWPGVAASLAVALALVVVVPSCRPRWRVFAATLVLSGVVAYGLLLLSYPAYFSRPDLWLLGAVSDSSQYSGTAEQETSGSWLYIPTRVVGLVMPPALLLFGAIGLLVAAFRRGARRSGPELSGWLLVGVQALLLPVLGMVRQSALGDDLRQVAFAAPAVALLLTAGWRQLGTMFGAEPGPARALLVFAWSTALLVPTAVQAQMFPYGYSYAAPQAGALGAIVQDDWARLSLRELVPEVPRDEFVTCRTKKSDRGETLRWGLDCLTDPQGSLSPYGLGRSDDDPFVADTFVAIFTRGVRPGSNCQELGRVERRRYFEVAVLSRVARCRLALVPYPEGGADLAQDGLGADYLLDGWTSRRSEPGVQLRGSTGNLGFELPVGWDGGSLRVELTGESDGLPGVYVNSRLLAVVPSPAGWSVDVPTAVFSASGRHLVLTLARPDGEEPVGLTGITIHQR